MEIKTFEARYELVEFCHYIGSNHINILELTVNTNDMDFLEDELSTIFAIETAKQTYVFSGYEVSECYEDENGLIKIVCIK